MIDYTVCITIVLLQSNYSKSFIIIQGDSHQARSKSEFFFLGFKKIMISGIFKFTQILNFQVLETFRIVF